MANDNAAVLDLRIGNLNLMPVNGSHGPNLVGARAELRRHCGTWPALV